jgi:hypothetical protein
LYSYSYSDTQLTDLLAQITLRETSQAATTERLKARLVSAGVPEEEIVLL